jgi:hypothetical protein
MTSQFKRGDLVFVTEKLTGYSRDFWTTGYFDREENGFYYISSFASKFKTATKITIELAEWLHRNRNYLELNNICLHSLVPDFNPIHQTDAICQISILTKDKQHYVQQIILKQECNKNFLEFKLHDMVKMISEEFFNGSEKD